MANDKSIAGQLGNPMAVAGAVSAEREAGKKDDATPLTQKARGFGGALAKHARPGKARQK